MNNLLTLEHVSIYHKESGKTLIEDISFSIQQGRTLAIVGESGSGKSVISKAIMGLLPESLAMSGRIFFEGQKISDEIHFQHRALLGTSLGVIVQNGMSAFDPLMKIGKQMSQTLIYHFSYTKKQALEETQLALSHVFPTQFQSIMQAFPHQLSGGQLQRVMIAIALALSPKLLIADEPTTALDAPLRRDILKLLQYVVTTRHSTLMFISHDLGLVNEIADDIVVMQEGRMVEYGEKISVLTSPTQAYTRYLINARKQLSLRFAQLINKKTF
ncbi:ABC transporter ATP-binding protein [Proteus vulgaris]|jgi:nickel transport system ATP-binding protein|uniref:ABC transporter ATP-binding protein n=1 Tax=Proteus TaxID=583 RepID=UPI000B4089B2|nr:MULTISPECIES: ABC transporter ATP-binding protein [Proteus]RNT30367.1 ABC transporter ATP-binding protein [Proteus mirabilis]MBG5970056.1 ABC transporter ATP-binding protein [Proteus vulgaris]MBG5985276.1 ABC transporter ATP-binding protein [Proteus vulgaris]MCH4255091.1 ABC transporter ATP-binding protein [Proteus vulgaris]MDM3561380.1 ABC transporter ATP-binding protein [Proteus vulgaris]